MLQKWLQDVQGSFQTVDNQRLFTRGLISNELVSSRNEHVNQYLTVLSSPIQYPIQYQAPPLLESNWMAIRGPVVPRFQFKLNRIGNEMQFNSAELILNTSVGIQAASLSWVGC